MNSLLPGAMSVKKASESYNIPRRTLRGYILSGLTRKNPVERKPVLISEQESDLVSRILLLTVIGYPVTTKTVRLSVYRFCTENKIPNPFNTVSGLAGRF